MNKLRDFAIRCYWNMAASNYKNGIENQEIFDKRFEIVKCLIELKFYESLRRA